MTYRSRPARRAAYAGAAASLSVAALLALAGCKAVGPDYVEPALTAPPGWASQIGGGASADPQRLARWWTTFNDETLITLVDRGVKGNLDLRLAEARVREARAIRGVVAADAFPTVNVFGDYTRSSTSENAGGGAFSRTNQGEGTDLYRAGFDATWELDIFGGVRRNVEAADADIAASQWQVRDVLVTLLGDIAGNYVDLRTAQQRLAVARGNAASQQQTVDLTQNRFRAGLTSELDVTRARSQFARTSAAIPVFEAQARTAIYSLSVLLGQAPGTLLAELDPEGQIPAIPDDVPLGVPADLIRRRPDLRTAERTLAADTARIGVATADLYPRFSIFGQIGLSSSQIGDVFEGDSRFWGIGPGVTWNLFDAGRVRSNIAVQEARVEQSLVSYEATLLRALREVDSAVITLVKFRERQAQLTDAVAAQQRAVDLATQLYSKGLTDFLSVLDTQRELFELQDQMVASQGEVTRQLVAVYKALGGGWEPSVAPDDPSINPAFPQTSPNAGPNPNPPQPPAGPSQNPQDFNPAGPDNPPFGLGRPDRPAD